MATGPLPPASPASESRQDAPCSIIVVRKAGAERGLLRARGAFARQRIQRRRDLAWSHARQTGEKPTARIDRIVEAGGNRGLIAGEPGELGEVASDREVNLGRGINERRGDERGQIEDGQTAKSARRRQ
jgi:hypothetical protein